MGQRQINDASQWIRATQREAEIKQRQVGRRGAGGPPAGTIMAFAGAVAPAGWAIADGTTRSRVDDADLFGVIGTTFGAGDGSTTYNLPNIKGRTIIGRDGAQTEFDVLGETGGAKNHALTLSAAGWAKLGLASGSNPAMAAARVTVPSYVETNRYSVTASSATPSGTTSAVELGGSTDSASTLDPYIALPWIIKLTDGGNAGSSGITARVVALEAITSRPRTTIAVAGATGNGTMTTPEAFRIVSIQAAAITSSPRIRFYRTAAARTADAARPYTTDPPTNGSLIAEFRWTAAGVVWTSGFITSLVAGSNTLYYAVDGGTADITMIYVRED